MELSVILVNHNAKNLTLNCIESIYNKTQKIPFEIILIDNHSSDGLVRAIKSKYPEIKIIENHKNIGFAKANNQAIKQSKGRFVLLLNNDVTLKNNALNLMLDQLNSNPKVGILTCKIVEPNGKTQKNCRAFYTNPFDTLFGRASLMTRLMPKNPISRKNTLADWDYGSPREVDWVSGACMMVRREVFEQVGLLDEHYFIYWEDTDFCKRAREAGWEIWFIPEAEIIHITGKGGGERSLRMKLFTMYQLHRSAYYYFLKHHYKHPLHPMAILTFLGMIYFIGIKGIVEILRSVIRL